MPALRDWLGAFGVDLEETRVDHYLDLPGVTGFGVKLRQGLLEIKARQGEPRPVTIGAIGGRIERWIKVSNPEPAAEWSDARWIPVEKRRRLHRLSGQVSGPAAVQQGPGHAGCTLELTELLIDGRDSWTLGFEAYGSPGDLEQALLSVARRVLTDLPAGVPLAVGRSHGYPGWLASVRAGQVPCP